MSEKLIKSLLSKGKLKAAIDVYNENTADEVDISLFLKNFFSNQCRELLLDFLLINYEKIPFNNRPIILKNLLYLAEMEGRIFDIERILILWDEVFDDDFFERNRDNEKSLVNAYNACLGILSIDKAEKVVNCIKNIELRKSLEAEISNIKKSFASVNISVDETLSLVERLKRRDYLKIKADTIVLKMSSNSINALAKGGKLAFPLILVEKLRKYTNNIVVLPQFSMPGPSLLAPFIESSEYKLVLIDCHKYSEKKNFIHYKATHDNKLQVDFCGYSGWSELQKCPHEHDYSKINIIEAEEFFLKKRFDVFGDKLEGNNTSDKYVLIPLQMPGDSVQKLAYHDYYYWLSTVVDYFLSIDRKVYITRHPKCKDPEVSFFLKKYNNSDRVKIFEGGTLTLIPGAEVIALCNSSVGWDAILAGKPILAFGESEYSRVVKNIKNLSDLYSLNNFSDIVNHTDYKRIYTYFWKYYVNEDVDSAKDNILEKVQGIFYEKC